MECGPQCAVINSMKVMQVLSADSLDTPLKVHLSVQVYSKTRSRDYGKAEGTSECTSI